MPSTVRAARAVSAGLNAATGQALETLHLDGAYCVFYREEFNRGDVHSGSYVLELHLSDPDGFTITAGGLAAYIAPAAREHGTPPVAAVAAVLADKDPTLRAGTPEHKQDRWARYQAKKAGDPNMWSYARWERQYSTNIQNASHGLKREAEHRLAWGGESKTLKTPITYRQIDIYRGAEKYCGQLKTGKMSFTKQAKEKDLPKDEMLIITGHQVEYILEKGLVSRFCKPWMKSARRIKLVLKSPNQWQLLPR